MRRTVMNERPNAKNAENEAENCTEFPVSADNGPAEAQYCFMRLINCRSLFGRSLGPSDAHPFVRSLNFPYPESIVPSRLSMQENHKPSDARSYA